MTFFEILLALLAVAIALLQISRRFTIPYPTMLAAAGAGLALIPGTPHVGLDAHTALALFVAPALVDAAFDFPVGSVWRLWKPLAALAVVAVLLSAAAVAALGVWYAGLPIYAAVALGAIVAPPDAAAATAILRSVELPRRSIAVLKGESMLNDGVALLLFSAATFVQSHGGFDAEAGVRLGLAAPGGLVFGFVIGKAWRHVIRFVTGTLGGNLLEFVSTFAMWILAERLGLSAVLTVVAFAMTIAGYAGRMIRPRVRIHTFAVWESVVFLLNVLAFLLMGLQARTIVANMGSPDRLWDAVRFAGIVIVCLVVVRMAWVLACHHFARRFGSLRGVSSSSTFRQDVLIGWCGMRGFVTLAGAFALPADFPQRDLIVLTAFAVVLATLIVQGITLAPLIRLLKLDAESGSGEELTTARAELATAALQQLEDKAGPAVDHWRCALEALRGDVVSGALEEKRTVGLAALRRQRDRLDQLRDEGGVSADTFIALQEELDFSEVALTIAVDQHIEES